MSERDDLQPWVDAALEEYKAHRAALLEGLAAAQRTLALGTTAVGILVAGAFNVWDSSDRLPATVLFLVVVPVVCALVVAQWAGQMLLLAQRNRYLIGLEGALSKVLAWGPATLFTWQEDWVQYFRPPGRGLKPDRRWQVNAAVPVFGLVAVGSLVLGVFKAWDDAAIVVASVAVVEFVALAVFGLWLLVELNAALPERADKAEPGAGSD